MKKLIFEYKTIEYIIEIGKNKKDNFDIIDASCISDIWFHVVGISSCHVLLKTNENISNIPRQVIKRCAYLCKINSKAKNLSKCDVSYTTMDNVIKTKNIGEVEVNNYKIISV